MSVEPTEKTISTNIVRYLRSLPRTHARKLHAGANPSQPDVDAAVAGRSVKLEVKRPSRRREVTPGQAKALTEWENAGALAAVVCSVDEVRALLASEGLLDAVAARPRPLSGDPDGD